MKKGSIIFITADLMIFYRLKMILDFKHIAYHLNRVFSEEN